jgi:hypothetical protein
LHTNDATLAIVVGKFKLYCIKFFKVLDALLRLGKGNGVGMQDLQHLQEQDYYSSSFLHFI